jgi:broad specificity phosphatase PhoE
MLPAAVPRAPARHLTQCLCGAHPTWQVACELVRERIGLNPCDLRREKHELQGEFPEMDFSQLPTETDPYWSTERESLPALQQRVNSFLAYLFESDTCSCDFLGVVTHNDFLTMLLYDSALAMASSMPEFRKFKNCEIQSYVVSRTTLSPCLDEASLSAEQRKRYPKSTGNVPKVQ